MRKTALLLLLAAAHAVGTAYAARQVEYRDSWAGHGLTIEKAGLGGLELNFSVERFTYEDMLVEGQTAKAVKMAGSVLPIGAGYPDLPVVSNYVAVPNGAKPVVEIVSFREEKFQNMDIAPGMEIPTEKDKEIKPLQKKAEIYSKNEFFPRDFIISSEVQKMRGVDVFILSISPFRYNPATRELVVRRDMKISVSFAGGQGEFGDDLYRHPMFERILQQNIVNYGSIQPTRYSEIHGRAAAQSAPGGKESGEFEYIILVPDDPAFIAWADTLKQFRKRQGIRTGVFTTAEIGGNTPALVEAFIDNAYNNWTIKPLAVLMMSDLGSTGKAYGLTSSHFMSHPAGYPAYVSDNVFADADITDAASTWSNGGAPEMVFARMPAQTAAHCSTMVKKIINYEKAPPSSASFYNLPLSAAGWQDERWFGMCSEIVRGFLKNKLGKTTQQQYALVDASGPAGGDPWSTTNPSALVAAYGPSPGEGYIAATVPSGMDWSSGTGAGVVSAINNGCFMIMHRDHGAYSGWGEPAFTTTNINSLTNTDRPFVFSMNCQTGAFQNATTETFSEKFHRIGYGALGVMCATEVSYSFVNDALIMGIMDGMWPNFNTSNNWDVPNAGSGQTYERYTEDLRPAFAMVSGKWHLMTQTYTDPAIPADYKEFTCQLFHVFGDPFMTFCSQIPDTFNLAFNPEIPTGSQSFSVNVKNKAGANVPGALVGLHMPTNSPEIVTSGLTDANGNVSIAVNPQVDGTLYVTATKSNFVRKETYTTVNAGTPSKPSIAKLFDGAKLPELRPALSFSSTDPQNNPIDYRVIWDTTAAFASNLRDSATTGTYASGTTVNFQFPSNLTAGRTYWWKVKGRDPAGTNMFGQASEPRSFTVGTDLPAGTACWMHTKGGQFSSDSYSGAAVAQGDSVVLAAPSSASAVLFSEDFEGGAVFPAGWTTAETNNNAYDWNFTSAGTTPPPAPGVNYPRIVYPSAGPAVGLDNDDIISPARKINTLATDLYLKYGWGMDWYIAGDSLTAWVRFFSSGVWGGWLRIGSAKAADGSGTDSLNLAGYLPKDSIQVKWRFSYPGTKNGQDAAIDNVLIGEFYPIPNANGTMVSGPIYYKDITRSETFSRSTYRWGKVLWRKRAAADSIGVQVQYCNNSTWALVPDAVLAGNLAGFLNQASAVDSLSLVSLDTLTYDSLRVVVNMFRPSAKASANPVLYDIEFARPGYMAPPLAVELAEFACALNEQNTVTISWKTASEMNNYRWEIERSADNESYAKIGELPAQGNGPLGAAYSFTDEAPLNGTNYYRLVDINIAGYRTYHGPITVTVGRPTAYALAQNYPNPISRGATTIKYALKEPGRTTLRIYNIMGQEVRTLVDGEQVANFYTVAWDGRNGKGREVANGVYFYHLTSGGFSDTKRMAVVR